MCPYSYAQDLTVDDYGGLQFEGCPEHLLISHPEAVEKVHAGFLEVGCDVVETDSFGGASIVLAEYQIAHLAYELNLKAAQLAKRVASDFSTKEKPRWVKAMIARQRKTLVVCRACHRAIHAGKPTRQKPE